MIIVFFSISLCYQNSFFFNSLNEIIIRVDGSKFTFSVECIKFKSQIWSHHHCLLSRISFIWSNHEHFCTSDTNVYPATNIKTALKHFIQTYLNNLFFPQNRLKLHLRRLSQPFPHQLQTNARTLKTMTTSWKSTKRCYSFRY